jgi:16S rRNA processing protein RimM
VLHSFTEPAANLFDYAPWYLQRAPGAAWTPISEQESKPHKEAYVVQINGIADRDEAQLLNGALIGVSRESIPEPELDEYFWHDLIGCRVTNEEGAVLGVVGELMETGAHAVLCVRPADSKRDLLVPFTQEYVIDVDAQSKQLRVNWQADWS